MKIKWHGPYQFFSCERECPDCHMTLMTQTLLGWDSLKSLFHDFGINAHCMSCNVRFRAFGTVTFKRLAVIVTFWCFLGMALLTSLIWIYIHSWILKGGWLFLSFLAMIFLPKYVFSVARKLWWKEAKLEKILVHSDVEECHLPRIGK